MTKIARSVSVAICITTYKRPIGLRRLLNSLHELIFCKSDKPDLSLVIVDNDASSPNKDLVDGIRDDFRIPVAYGVESRRGIASARNRAVQLAGAVDFVAFIDDDEVADAHWLDELLNAQSGFKVDIVNGPVIPRFEQPAPAWVIRGRFYDRRRFPTGTVIQTANTGNVLIKSSWLHSVPGPFSETLNLSGGEDTLFFAQVYRQGAKMIWADEAIVEEFNPPSRVSPNWILRRAFRWGIETSRRRMTIDSFFKETMIYIFKSVMHILLGFLLLLPASICCGYAGSIRSLMYVSLGVGEIGGFFGVRYMEYRQTHGE